MDTQKKGRYGPLCWSENSRWVRSGLKPESPVEVNPHKGDRAWLSLPRGIHINRWGFIFKVQEGKERRAFSKKIITITRSHKQCCDEHWGTRVSFNSGFLSVYAQNQYSENEHTTQRNLQIQCNPYQATNGIFDRARTNNFTICMEIPPYTFVQTH